MVLNYLDESNSTNETEPIKPGISENEACAPYKKQHPQALNLITCCCSAKQLLRFLLNFFWTVRYIELYCYAYSDAMVSNGKQLGSYNNLYSAGNFNFAFPIMQIA